jgi:hypothetical protein
MEQPIDYYTSPNFFINNVAYQKQKDRFDYNLYLFNESENLKKKLSGLKISTDKQMADVQVACGLIFVRCQQLLISILRLCNEGNVEDAGILLRTLFENYIQMKFIIKNDSGSLFLGYNLIKRKRFIDLVEENDPKAEILKSDDYREFKVKLDKQFNEIKHDYMDRKGEIRQRWCKENLRDIAKDVGSEKIYLFITQTNSPYVHCDSSGMLRFMNGDENETVFDGSPTTEFLDMILDGTSEFFGKVATELAGIFKVDIPESLEKFLKKNNP